MSFGSTADTFAYEILFTLGVDAVDADGIPVTADSQVEFAYAARDPRSIRLPNATRTHHWRNPVGWLRVQAIGMALVLALLGLVVWAGRRWERRKRV